jgi:hypothetical protein
MHVAHEGTPLRRSSQDQCAPWRTSGGATSGYVAYVVTCVCTLALEVVLIHFAVVTKAPLPLVAAIAVAAIAAAVCVQVRRTMHPPAPAATVDVLFLPAAGGGNEVAVVTKDMSKIANMFTLYAAARPGLHNLNVRCVTDEAACTAPLHRRLTVRVYANQSGRGCRLQRIPDVDPQRDVNVELSQGTGSNIVAPDRIITYHYEEGAMEGPETTQCLETLIAVVNQLCATATPP